MGDGVVKRRLAAAAASGMEDSSVHGENGRAGKAMDSPAEDPPAREHKKTGGKWMRPTLTLVALVLLTMLQLYSKLAKNYSSQRSTDSSVGDHGFDGLTGLESLEFTTPSVVTVSHPGPCSGNGVYEFGEDGSRTGPRRCRCHACFTGEDCSTLESKCVLDLDKGDPTFFEKYWLMNPSSTVIEGWQHLSYAANTNRDFFFAEPELEAAIHAVHDVVGNAVTKGRHLVIGVGASQLYQAALFALSVGMAGKSSTPVSVVCAAPYYSVYPLQTDFLRSGLFKWAGDARDFKQRQLDMEEDAIANNHYIEVVTTPNNPTGEIQYPVVDRGAVRSSTESAKLVYDLAYYWPQYTPITAPADQDLMIFSISKCTGHAGARVGWAIVKDLDIAIKMAKYISINTFGQSRDAQFRTVQLLRSAIKGSGLQGSNYKHDFAPPQRTSSGDVDHLMKAPALFHFGSSELAYRWAQLRSVLQGSPHFSLPQFQPAFCKFFGELSTPTPAFAWVKCNYEDNCEKFFRGHGILTRGGPLSGTEAKYTRISMLDRRNHFDHLIDRLKEIMKQLAG